MEDTNAIETFALLVIYLVLLISLTQAVVLGYHWYSYGASKRISNIAMVVFLAGAVVLIGGLLICYLYL